MTGDLGYTGMRWSIHYALTAVDLYGRLNYVGSGLPGGDSMNLNLTGGVRYNF